MILNEHQYNLTLDSISKFEETLNELEKAKGDIGNKNIEYRQLQLQLHIDCVTSMLKELKKEIREYEQL